MFDTTAKNTMINAITVNQLRLHSADPGAASDNEIAGTATACSYTAAANGSRALSATVNVTSSEASDTDAAWFTLWNGATRQGKFQLDSVKTLTPGIAATITALPINALDV